MISILSDITFAIIACFGFSYLNSTPRHIIFYVAIVGGLGHAIRYFLISFQFLNISAATLVASFCVGIIAMMLARIKRVPIETIAFPAMLPMVPGIFAYKSILGIFGFMQNNELEIKVENLVSFFDNFFITISVIVALAVGVSMSLIIFYEKSFTMTRKNNLKDKFK